MIGIGSLKIILSGKDVFLRFISSYPVVSFNSIWRLVVSGIDNFVASFLISCKADSIRLEAWIANSFVWRRYGLKKLKN